MKAWVVDDTAAAEPLAWREVPEPAAAPGKALVGVEAAALNFSDLLMIRGRYQVRPPLRFIPGQEIAGTVLAGSGRLRAGQRIASKARSRSSLPPLRHDHRSPRRSGPGGR